MWCGYSAGVEKTELYRWTNKNLYAATTTKLVSTGHSEWVTETVKEEPMSFTLLDYLYEE